MISKFHYFFSVDKSLWPFLTSLSVSNVLFSLLIFFKFTDFHILMCSISMLILASFLWWINYSGEFNFLGGESFWLENSLKFSMIMFISSEIFFFFSFFWSYFHFFFSPSMDLGFSWPPSNLEFFDFSSVPLINTLILLSSGVCVTASHNFMVKKGPIMLFSLLLFLGISLGAFFTLLQLMEYASSFFSISDSVFGTSFFLLTGFHGIHVLVGTLFLLFTLVSSVLFYNYKNNFVSFELASWYWHFVDVVWLFLFYFIYFVNY